MNFAKTFQSSILVALMALGFDLSTTRGQDGFDSKSTIPFERKTNDTEALIIPLDLCFVLLIEDVDVPASESGLLKTLKVKEGDYVNLSDQVATVDDQVAKQQLAEAMARLAIAEKKASDKTDIKAAELTYTHAHNEYQREKKLVADGAGAQTKVDSWLFEARKALAMIDRAKNARHLAELDKLREEVLVKTARDAIERHLIRTPLDGNVFEIYQPAGSWVNAGDKVLRVIRMNRLRVKGFVDAGRFDRHQVSGQKVTVTATLARGRQVEFEGVVSYVGLDEQAGNRFMVWAEVENKAENGQWILVPNDEVTMKIHLQSNPVTTNVKPDPRQPDPRKFKSLPVSSSQFSADEKKTDSDQR